jgi:hypothetical protein
LHPKKGSLPFSAKWHMHAIKKKIKFQNAETITERKRSQFIISHFGFGSSVQNKQTPILQFN